MFAAGVAASPVPIVAMLLLLGGTAPARLGTAFVIGWAAGVACVLGLLVVVVAVTGATDDDPAWIAIAQLAVGVVFLAAAAVLLVAWRRRRASATPRWLSALDALGPGRTAGLGAVLATVNPKNLALMLGAAIALAQTELPPAAQTAAVAGFVALACLGVGVPLALRTLRPERWDTALERFRRWLTRHQHAVLIVLCLVLGARFASDGLLGL